MNAMLTILFWSVFGLFHPVHVSMTNMEYFAESGKLELSVRIFKEDIETAILHDSGINPEFAFNDEYEKNRLSLSAYCSKNLKIISSSGDICDFEMDRFEVKDDVVWLYLQCSKMKDVDALEMKNSLLSDLFPDQKNLVIFTSGEFQKGYEFSAKNRVLKIKVTN